VIGALASLIRDQRALIIGPIRQEILSGVDLQEYEGKYQRMHPLKELLKNNEMWLMRRIRDYAVERDFARYTSTLEEAWRVSIVGLTDSIISALAISEEPWELNPDDDYITDPIAAFGVIEAQRHRSRGISIEMFLGLMKYYKQSYLDLIRMSYPTRQIPTEAPINEENHDGARYGQFIERAFDRIEIAFCAEWSRSETINHAIVELQETNRQLTNEKNKFLTIIESIPTAVFLLDDNRYIIHMNHAGAQMISPEAKSGAYYYSQPESRIRFPWMEDEFCRFRETGEMKECESLIELPDGDESHVLVNFKTMQDISFKYPGTVVILNPINELKMMERELKRSKELRDTILNAIEDAVCLINTDDFSIVDGNSSFLAEYRSAQHLIPGSFCYEITHSLQEPCGPPHDECPLKETVREGKTAHSEHRHFFPDGSEAFIDIITSPVMDEKGKVIQVVHIARDITERKKAEKEKEKLIKELKTALEEIKTIKGIIPICMHCKGIRDDKGAWKKLEEYVTEHSEAQFSHGICEACLNKYYPEEAD
jgi:PAS domain-containing protein